jgi:hypothetical protein
VAQKVSHPSPSIQPAVTSLGQWTPSQTRLTPISTIIAPAAR